MKDFNQNKPLDLLQNIESGIIDVYRADPSLLDVDAKDAIDALARHYHSEEEQRTPSPARLSNPAQNVFLAVHALCEWRLGRLEFAHGEPTESSAVVTLPELVKALREIQKSIPRWTKQGGRKGYLDFVGQFLP